jgi:FAD/FMN-containing dehydrogenase
MRIEERKEWRNVGGNQSSTPKLSFWPESRDDLIEIVRRAEANGATVRAIGSSHSWSDVAKTEDYLIYTERLKRVLDLGKRLLREDAPFRKEHLVHVECGITIRELNQVLDSSTPRLALINLGGFDGQTVCGVTSTSTHGSGITFGPLCDFIRSMELVGENGKVYRIEPSIASGRALTDPAAYAKAYPDTTRFELIQDDQWFDAAIVGLGCLGVIYSAVLQVRPAFLLKETRTLTTWREVKASLMHGAIYRTPEHYELLINPYAVDGANRCLITTRVETRTPGDRERSIYIKYRAVLDVSAWWVRLLAWLWPGKIKATLNTAIGALKDDDYTERSYRVFHIGEANYIPAISSEFAVPIENDAYLAAIDRLVAVAEEVGQKERLYLTVPVAVRFVKATSALLSPMNGRDTCMLEVIALAGVKNSERIMERIEQALEEFNVRPHWGQINHIRKERLLPMYGSSYTRWQEIHRTLNSRGTFSGPFSRRVGLEER